MGLQAGLHENSKLTVYDTIEDSISSHAPNLAPILNPVEWTEIFFLDFQLMHQIVSQHINGDKIWTKEHVGTSSLPQ